MPIEKGTATMSKTGTPEAFEQYVEQNLSSLLSEYADAAQKAGKLTWAMAMNKAAYQLNSQIESTGRPTDNGGR